MISLDNFDEFLKKGVAKKQKSDISRANFLLDSSARGHNSVMKFIEAVGISYAHANHIVKNVYDVIIELIRAKMLIDGFSASGNRAHESEVAYMVLIGFNKKEVDFMNQLRYFRNGIIYYGKVMDKAYAEEVLYFMGDICPKLKKLISDSLKS